MSECERLVGSPIPDAAAVFVTAKLLGPIVEGWGSVLASADTRSSDAVESARGLSALALASRAGTTLGAAGAAAAAPGGAAARSRASSRSWGAFGVIAGFSGCVAAGVWK